MGDKDAGAVPPIYIVCRTDRSGLTDYSVSLARALAQHTGVTLITGRNLPAHFGDMDFAVWRWFGRARTFPLEMWRLLALFRARKGVVLFQSWQLLPLLELTLVWMLRRSGHHLALTVHDTLPHHPRPWSRWLLARYYGQFDRLIAHSLKSRDDLLGMGLKQPILVVPHGSYDLFRLGKWSRSAARERFGLEADKIAVLLFGRLDMRKGVGEFIEMAAALNDEPRLHFLLIGRDDLAGADRICLAQGRKLTNLTIIEKDVPFEEVEAVFLASDLVVLPYREGTTSGVFKLAMAFQKPVLASEVGDLAEAAAQGLLTGLGPPQAVLLNAIERLGAIAGGAVMPHAPELANEFSWQSIGEKYWRFLSSKSG